MVVAFAHRQLKRHLRSDPVADINLSGKNALNGRDYMRQRFQFVKNTAPRADDPPDNQEFIMDGNDQNQQGRKLDMHVLDQLQAVGVFEIQIHRPQIE